MFLSRALTRFMRSPITFCLNSLTIEIKDQKINRHIEILKIVLMTVIAYIYLLIHSSQFQVKKRKKPYVGNVLTDSIQRRKMQTRRKDATSKIQHIHFIQVSLLVLFGR